MKKSSIGSTSFLLEQYPNIKFYAPTGMTLTGTFKFLHQETSSKVSWSIVFECQGRFKEGHDELTYNSRAGRLYQWKQTLLLLSMQCMGTRAEIALETNLSSMSIHKILAEHLRVCDWHKGVWMMMKRKWQESGCQKSLWDNGDVEWSVSWTGLLQQTGPGFPYYNLEFKGLLMVGKSSNSPHPKKHAWSRWWTKWCLSFSWTVKECFYSCSHHEQRILSEGKFCIF